MHFTDFPGSCRHLFVFKMPHACCIKGHSLLEWVSGSEDACLNIQYSCRGFTIFQLLPTKHCTLHAYGASVISFAVQYLPTYGVSPWRRVSPMLPIMLRVSWEAEGPVLPLPSCPVQQHHGEWMCVWPTLHHCLSENNYKPQRAAKALSESCEYGNQHPINSDLTEFARWCYKQPTRNCILFTNRKKSQYVRK